MTGRLIDGGPALRFIGSSTASMDDPEVGAPEVGEPEITAAETVSGEEEDLTQADQPPARSTRSPRSTVIVIAIVVVVSLVLAGLYFARTNSPSSQPPQAGAEPYSQAESIAGNYSRTPAGDWLLVNAVGIASPASLSYGGSSEPGCVLPPTYVPSTQGGDVGTARLWIFEYVGEGFPGSPAVLFLKVDNGSAGLLADWTNGTQCTQGFQQFGTILNVPVDSPAIASAAASAGGEAFSSSNSGTTAIYTLSGGFAPGAPQLWTVRYDPCGIQGVGSSLSGMHPYLQEAFYARNGTRDVAASSNGTESCVAAGSHPVGLGSPTAYQPSNGSGWYYNLSLQVDSSLPLADLGVLVSTTTGALPAWNNAGELWNPPPAGDVWESPPYANEWYCVLGGTTGPAVGVFPTQYPGQPITWQELRSGQAVVATGEVLTIISSDSLTNDQVSIYGVNGVIASGSQQL